MKARLIKELQKLEDYLESYRKQTAQMALTVVNQTEDVNVFFDMEVSLTIVNSIINEDVHSVQDVAKMLNHTMREFRLHDTMPDDIKQQLEERMKKENAIIRLDPKSLIIS